MVLFGRKSVVFDFSCLLLHYIISVSLVPSAGLHTAEVLSKYMLK